MLAQLKMLSAFIGWSGGPAKIACDLVFDKKHGSLLSCHNGLTAFDGALRIFGTCPGPMPTLQDWNHPQGWRAAYKDLVKKDMVFFAEDVFGNQFAFHNGRVCYFEAETGKTSPFASSFSEWLSRVLEDPVDSLQLMSYRNWLNKGGLSEHLCPVYPFIVKAEPPVRELYRVSSTEDMSYKGDFAYQIKDIPDGAQIKLRVIE
jgi:Protein of unknown function DUF2625